jgi:hypothetical protein
MSNTLKCYASEHWISRTIMPAFAEGVRGQIVPPVTLLDGPAATYGILRGCDTIIRQCEEVNRDYWYLDHGYIRPSGHTKGDFSGHYRVVHNGRQRCPEITGIQTGRFEALDTDIRPWRRRGRHVLVIPLTGAVADFYGIPQREWLETTIREIAQHTDRPIRVKEKGDGDIQESLEDCWCLVTHSSNTAVDALLAGVPVITLGGSAVAELSWKFGHIENPYWPDREPILHGLADNQFTLAEMRSGYCAEQMGIEVV